MVEINEQWKDVGDCSVCRRQKYCSKPCKRAQMRRQSEIAGMFANVMLKAMAGAYTRDPK